MKKITFQFQPTPQMAINDHVFDLQMGDGDIFDRALVLREHYSKLDGNTDVKQVLRSVRACAALIDEILGKGAMATIAEGRPVSIPDALKLMNLVLEEAASGYYAKLDAYEP